MRLIFVPLFLVFALSLHSFGVEATEAREWKATSGHSVTAKALKVDGGDVVFELDSGGTVNGV